MLPEVKRARTCLIISASLIVLALILTIFGLGINLGIDFKGGQSLTYELGTEITDEAGNTSFVHAVADQSTLEGVLAKVGIVGGQVTIQGEDKSEVIIRLPADAGTDDELADIRSNLLNEIRSVEMDGTAVYADTRETATSSVSGTFSSTLVSNAVTAVLIAAVLMLIYIAIRFDLNSGIAAVFGLIHDVLMMLAFMVFLRWLIQMNSTFIAAMLTIVGYSINNTIVIFDRIRENAKKLPGVPRASVVSRSVKECLGRTINTTLTTLVTIVLLYILGVDSIREFALPIIVGILSGVYSANLINGYVWAWLEEKRLSRKTGKKPVQEN